MALSIRDFFYTQLFATIPEPKASFTDKTVIITGGNIGLGYESAQKVLFLGATKVILGCRSTQRGEAAKETLIASTKCHPDTIEVWPVDLSVYESVKEFAARAKGLARIDALIANAGVQMNELQIAEGTEMSMTINVVSTLLVSSLLLSKMQETAKKYATTPHLTIVSSALYSIAKFPEKPWPEDIFAWLGENNNAKFPNQ
jgi:retinol dehydrogenase-12